MSNVDLEEFAHRFQENATAKGCLCPAVTDALFETVNSYKPQSKTPFVDATVKAGKTRLAQKTINDVIVPSWIQELVTIAEGDGLYVITKGFDRSEQGKTDWVKINNWVKDQGGKWISAKADSRWEIPRR